MQSCQPPYLPCFVSAEPETDGGLRRATLDEVASVSYALTEGEYAANEAGDTWVAALMGALGAELTGLQPLLTPDNYDTLVGLLLEDITSRARLTRAEEPSPLALRGRGCHRC